MALRLLQLLLYLVDTRVQVVHQVLLFSINVLPSRVFLELLVIVLDLRLQVHYLLLVLLDDLLAEVGALGELLLDFFMILQVLGQVCDNTLHFVVFEHEIFRAF